jgi:hypothetical protein
MLNEEVRASEKCGNKCVNIFLRVFQRSIKNNLNLFPKVVIFIYYKNFHGIKFTQRM